MPPFFSLIITTYNWPLALDRVLASIDVQMVQDVEVIIADDGSTEETADCIKRWQAESSIPIIHVWQEDQGFRAAAARNRAVAKARGAYLLFIDGDCVLPMDFLWHHQRLAEQGTFVSGPRVLCSPEFSEKILSHSVDPRAWDLKSWKKAKKAGWVNRWVPFYALPLGPLRHLQSKRWKGAKTCHLGVWKNDFMAINGFNEEFEGWGFEDSDLVIRLINQGIAHKQGRFATAVIHLWHPENSRSHEKANWQRLEKTQSEKITWISEGVSQYV